MALMDNDKTVHEIQTDDQLLEHYSEKEYEWGFVSDVESETLPPGLSEETVRFISAKKNEPEWMLEWRLKAFRHFLTLTC
jgi:Fe-S cluster assembly protein SufB